MIVRLVLENVYFHTFQEPVQREDCVDATDAIIGPGCEHMQEANFHEGCIGWWTAVLNYYSSKIVQEALNVLYIVIVNRLTDTLFS